MTYAPEFIFLIILSTVTICAFQIFCKTPRLKTDANRFIGKTVLQKAQIMPVVSIIGVYQRPSAVKNHATAYDSLESGEFLTASISSTVQRVSATL